MDCPIGRLVRQTQIVQGAIYSSETAVTQVLAPAVHSFDSQLGLRPLQNMKRHEGIFIQGPKITSLTAAIGKKKCKTELNGSQVNIYGNIGCKTQLC